VTFQEFAPSPLLRPYVDRYWLVETSLADAHPMEHLLTPNGRDGFVFQFYSSVLPLYVQAAQQQVLPPAYALLQPFAPWRLRLLAPCGIAGVFFRPGIVHRWLRCPMQELTQQPWDLQALLGKEVRHLLEQLGEAHLDSASCVRRLEAFVARRLPVFAHPPTYTDHALRLLAQSPGPSSVQALAGQLGVSRQFLARQFAEHVGLSPKQVGRVLRFNAVHQWLAAQLQPNWLDAAYRFGYYDQAHFIKEFHAFTGASPTAYQRAATEAADFYAG
jgi:AraC-like DNA-binding protein